MPDKQSLSLRDESLNNCAMDLQRAAIAFWRQPKGKTAGIFLRHAHRLGGRFSPQISTLEKQVSHPPDDRREVVNLADKMLTLGCLLKK